MPRYANVVSTLALFAALGGTATAAVTLDRDSVGSPQIRADAVRSPELAADAVRSAEIRDESVKVRDLTPDARSVLESKLRVAEATKAQQLAECADLAGCPVLVSRTLAPGSWLVQARLAAHSPDGTGEPEDRCGLVTADAAPGPRVIDSVRIGETRSFGDSPVLTLSGVVKDVAAGTPAVSVRCTRGRFEAVNVADVKLTALEVGAVTGP
jgi:hypothetical protein